LATASSLSQRTGKFFTPAMALSELTLMGIWSMLGLERSCLVGLLTRLGTSTHPATFKPIKVPVGGALAAKATTLVRFGGNLDTRLDIGSTQTLSFTVYDSQGNPHLVSLTFTKTAPNTWDWQAEFNGSVVGSGTVQFSDQGQWQSGIGTITLTLTNGAASPQTIQLDFSSLNQLASTTTASAVFQDGFPVGVLETLSVDARGLIIGSFSTV